ncbi:S8 family peptidase [Paenibacillus alba]|uniref:S8 family peptidase n=1 Tax=Paenibacillus alba TaxID=1197127 RepID=UPI0015639C1B|nr:S8 family peptidase [Paenibacillus alba]NQX68953.1 S8 family peptidase [Paenibacillus alba]
MKFLLKSKPLVSSLLTGVLLFSISSVGGVEAASLLNKEEAITAGSGGDKSKLNLIQNSPIQVAALSNSEQRVIVTFKDKKKANKTLIQKSKGKVKRENKHSSSLAVTLPSSEIDQLKNDSSVESVEPDIQLQAATQTMEWGVSVINATYAWNSGYTGSGVKVAILDSGIDTQHEDLSVAGGASFVDYTTSYDDDNGHGTHVAGIIGAKNNETGVVGVAPDADLYAVKVLDATGKGYLSDVIAGIDWAVDHKIDVINLSMATNVDSPALHKAVDQAYDNGLLVVAAAGNAGNKEGTGDSIQYPAKYNSVIAVGAMDQNRQRAPFSSTGSELEVSAPGEAIYSTYLNNGYKISSGTSMASAFVTGELALLKQQKSKLTNVQLRQLLDQNAVFKNNTPAPGMENSVTDSVYNSVYGMLSVAGIDTGPSVTMSYKMQTPTTGTWNELSRAKSYVVVYDDFLQCNLQYYLFNDNTVWKTTSCRGTTLTDDTYRWPDLTNAKSISYSIDDSRQYTSIYYYVLYHDNTIKYKHWRSNSNDPVITVDDTINWPEAANAKAISFSEYISTNRFVLTKDNRVKTGYRSQVEDVTSFWPDVTNARDIHYAPITGNYDNNPTRYVSRLDQAPNINISNQNNQVVYQTVAPNIITLSGTAQDLDGDNLTISASIAGVIKTATLTNTLNPQAWSLQWNVSSDNIPPGTYRNINVSTNDGLWGTANAAYNGTITVNRFPYAPTSLNPGTTSAANPQVLTSLSPALNWTFSDPDAGDYQSSYDVQLYSQDGSTLISDSGWINSSIASYSVPSGKLNRGTTYAWKVKVKDSSGGESPFSQIYYIRINTLPVLNINSYTNGQQVNDNVLTLSWTYQDADGQPQYAYQVLGSRDNWATVGYNSGVVTSNGNTHSTTPLPNGTWDIKVMVHDGYEWSNASMRTGLVLPNAFEPNDTNAQAFPINYNTQYSSLISSATDVDFYKYIAPVTGVDRFTLNIPNGLIYEAYIYDSSMNLIGTNSKGVPTLYTVGAGMTYYIKINGVGGSFSNTATYSFLVNKYNQVNKANYQYDSNGNITNKTTTITN